MTVNLCNTPDEQNVIGKARTVIDTVSCTIKGNISYENPILLLSYDGAVADNINYMEIPELNRCYFISDIINLTGGRYEIHGKVDVLESFKDAVLGLTAIVDKVNDQNTGNLFLDDGSFVSENKEFNTVLNFSGGFNDEGEYILITAGGGGGII